MAFSTTSTSLLKAVSSDAGNPRWPEFVQRYRPMMVAFLKARFPSVDPDDIVQETLCALAAALPGYRYAPDETGHFRNYLTGILRHKAIRAVEREARNSKLLCEYAKTPPAPPPSLRSGICADASDADDGIAPEADEAAWRASLMEIALRELLADEDVHERTREVFRRVAVNGEKPEDVANSFGITRNAVDQMKNRMMIRLRSIVRSLECDGA